MDKNPTNKDVLSDYMQLQDKVAALLGYSPTSFEFAMAEYPNESLDKVSHPDISSSSPVFHGKVRLVVDYWRVSSGAIHSEILDSPTWKTLICTIDKILTANESDYVFLEDMHPTERDPEGVLEVQLFFGS